MEKKILAVGIAIILLIVVFSGCFDNNQQLENTFELNEESSKFIGTWNNMSYTWNDTFIFYSDGKCMRILHTMELNDTSYYNYTFRVEDDGNLYLTKKYDTLSLTDLYWYHFKNNNTELWLWNTEIGPRYAYEHIYTKQ